MKKIKPVGWLLSLLILVVLGLALPARAQTPAPGPTPTPTQIPAILVLQPSATPAPPPQGGTLQQFWQQYQAAILAALIGAVVTGILVGVFLKRMAEGLANLGERLFHALFDRFASAPLLRLRYENDYRRTLADALQSLAGSNLVDRPMQLEQVYVPVSLTEETYAAGEASFEDRFQWDEDRRRRQRARAVEPWEAVRRFPRLVVLGGPGAGKTTYLAHLAFLCARRQRLPGYLPVFVRLRDLAQAARLEDALPQEFEKRRFPNAGGFVQRQLAAGRCLLLLDGLDELPDPAQYQRVIGLVQDFADRHVRAGERPPGRGNLLVVSCRTYSYEHGQQLSGFTRTEVMEFDEGHIERFLYNWFAQAELRPLAGELLAALEHNRRFKELARNPLLLLLIAYHYERERNLPQLRAELYQHCIRTRITRWNTQRGTHQGRFGEGDKWRLLRELALDFYRQEWRGLLTGEQLRAWLEGFAASLRLPEGTPAEALLDEVARTSGLLQEWAIGRYGFSHQTLQEYFAAEGAERLGPEEGAALLGAHLDEPAWQEVLLLYCGLSGNLEPLLRRLLEHARQNGAPAWLLAGRCLAQGGRGVSPRTCRQVAEGLFAHLRRPQEDAAAFSGEAGNEAVALLQSMAPEALPGYVAALLAEDTPAAALLAARLLPPQGDPALRQQVNARLARLARQGQAGERRAAAAALGWVGSGGEQAVQALLPALQDRDPAGRAAAARALGRLGQPAPEAVNAALLRLYESETADAPRHAALEALLALGAAEQVGLCCVPAGEFAMGSPPGEAGAREDERPQVNIYLPAYYIQRTPVTNAQFRRFLEAGGYANQAYWAEAIAAGRWKDGVYIDPSYYGGGSRTAPAYWDDPQWNGAQQPVVEVSWYEALAYARWAGLRLPTEAEWEKAASWEVDQGSGNQVIGGRKRVYPWGDTFEKNRCNTEEAGIKQTTPVGQYSPQGDSPYGCADMGGNVWEWCQSAYRPYPYSPDDGREALGGGDDVTRVLRGGSWYNDKNLARCACRDGGDPGYRYNYGGFRCVCATSSLSSGSDS